MRVFIVTPATRSRGAEVAAALALFGSLATVFWVAGIRPYFQPGHFDVGALDQYYYFYPKFIYGAAALRHGRIPLWNPYEFCGMPFLATAQVAALYPPMHVAFLVFPAHLALEVNFVAHLAIAGLALYAYLRWLGIRRPAAGLGGVLFAFNPAFVASIHHPMRIMVVAWAPLVLLLWQRALRRRTVGAAALAGGGIAWQLVAGYPGLVLCMLVLLAFATAIEAWEVRGDGRGVAGVFCTALVAIVLGFALAGPQILPLAELTAQSGRTEVVGAWNTSRGSGASTLIGAVLLPFFAMVATGPALGLALGGVAATRGTDRWLSLGGLVIVGGAIALHTGLLQHLPGFAAMRFVGLVWTVFPPLFASILVAFGFDRLAGSGVHNTRGMLTLVAIPLAFWTVAWSRSVYDAGPAIVTLGTGVVTWLSPIGGRVHRLLPPAIALAYVGLHVLPPAGPITPYPTREPNPALGVALRASAGGGRLIAPALVREGVQMTSAVPVVSGYEGSLPPRGVERLLQVAGLKEAFVGQPVDWTTLAERLPLLDVLGVTLILGDGPKGELHAAGLLPGPAVPGVGPTLRPHAPLGRAYVVHRIQSARSADEAIRIVTDVAFHPREEAVVVGQLPEVSAPTRPSQARVVSDEPEEVTVEARLDAPGLLVLADGHHPGWSAWVDGHEAPILLTNGAFRGVTLPTGTHRVVFRYRPRSFFWGVALAVISVILAVVLRRRPLALRPIAA